MNAETGARPTPFVLDSSVLAEVARADSGLMSLIQSWDAVGQPMVIPALAITAASLDMRSPEAEELLHGLERMENSMVAPLRDADQSTRLADVITRTGLDPWNAHVAAVADASVCPIVTLDGSEWQKHAHDLDERLHFIEIADPDDIG